MAEGRPFCQRGAAEAYGSHILAPAPWASLSIIGGEANVRSVVTLLVFATAWTPRPAPAQSGPALSGRVLSATTGLPIPAALVAIEGRASTLTDEHGRFLFEGLAGGPVRVLAVGPGCHQTLESVVVPDEGPATLDLSVELPPESDPTLDPDAWSRDQRRAAGAARVMEADEIQRRGFRSMVDAVRILAPAMVGRESPGVGGRGGLQGRSRNTATGSVEPLLLVDGVRITQRTAEALALIDVNTVRRVEVIRGTAGGWSYGTQAVNGVVRIETIRSPTHAPDTPPSRCPVTFPM